MEPNTYTTVVEMMPRQIAQRLLAVNTSITRAATEIRLRAGKVCAVYAQGRPYFVTKKREDQSQEPVVLEQAEIRSVLAHMCEYALYKKEDELRNGFLTIKGGHRIGVCATRLPCGDIDIASISSLSVRIAREHRGCAAELFGKTMRDGLTSVLVAGPPLSGKTTILRDLTRILASQPLYQKVVVIDERGELASVYNGVPTLDVGTCTDVLDGYPRAVGFDIALRTLSPDVVVCDELGSDTDFDSITSAGKSGVHVIASIHAPNREALLQKPAVKRCVDTGIFSRIVFLEPDPNIGKIRQVCKVVCA